LRSILLAPDGKMRRGSLISATESAAARAGEFVTAKGRKFSKEGVE
jgi:hypothetical protein